MSKTLIEEIKANICDTCKECETKAIDENENRFTIKALYCKDGEGYIEIDIYNEEGEYVDSCKINKHSDSCVFPFNLNLDEGYDCGCL